jgi:dienelactone hydrolase
MKRTETIENEILFWQNNVITPSHGRSLLADVAFSSAGKVSPAIIFSHGFKGFKDWGPFNLMARKFAEEGFHFIKYNFAFNGTTIDSPYEFSDLEAFGQNNFSHELEDIDSVINWVQKDLEGLEPKEIFLLGHSRGGGISILKTSLDPRISAIAAWGSVSRFTRYISLSDIRKWKESGVMYVENARTGQMMPLFIQLYEDYYRNRKKFDIHAAVQSMKRPVLLVHGTDDETVPVEHARELTTLNADVDLIEIPYGGHTFGATHPMEAPGLPEQMVLVIEKTIDFYRGLS